MDNEPNASSYNVLAVIVHRVIKYGSIVFLIVAFNMIFRSLPIGIPLKILLLYMPMSIVLFVWAIQFIVGKRTAIEGKRTLYDLFMVLFLLFISIGMSYDVLADTILQDYETETITVKEIRTPRLRGLIEKDVYSIDGKVYNNLFNEFTITRGETYEITYLARMKTIIDVEEVEE